MITINIKGGLGNQLFQIYTLISYCLDNNKKYFIKYIETSPSCFVNRNVYWNNLFKNLNIITDDIYCIEYWEKNNLYNEIPVFDDQYSIKLNGYFQSYKYFENNIDIINKTLDIENLKINIKKKTNLDYSTCISIHFRLGDYKKLSDHYNILPIEYYINSLKKILEKTNKQDYNILYFYEKEDKEIIDKNIEKLKNNFKYLHFISCNHNLADWEQMLEMSLCSHNVIANSTFSVWSSYLNNNINNITTYPEKWYNSILENNTICDIIKKNWIKI